MAISWKGNSNPSSMEGQGWGEGTFQPKIFTKNGQIVWVKKWDKTIFVPSGYNYSLQRVSSLEPTASTGGVAQSSLYYGDTIQITISKSQVTERIRTASVKLGNTTVASGSVTASSAAKSWTSSAFKLTDENLTVSITVDPTCTVRINNSSYMTSTSIKNTTLNTSYQAGTTYTAYEGDTITWTEQFNTGFADSNSTTASSTAKGTSRSKSVTLGGNYTHTPDNPMYMILTLEKLDTSVTSGSVRIGSNTYNYSSSSTKYYWVSFGNLDATSTFTTDKKVNTGTWWAIDANDNGINDENKLLTGTLHDLVSPVFTLTKDGIYTNTDSITAGNTPLTPSNRYARTMSSHYKVMKRAGVKVFVACYHDWGFAFVNNISIGAYSNYTNGIMGYCYSAITTADVNKTTITNTDLATHAKNASYSSTYFGCSTVYRANDGDTAGGLGNICQCGNQTMYAPKADASYTETDQNNPTLQYFSKDNCCSWSSGCPTTGGSYQTCFYAVSDGMTILKQCVKEGGLANWGTHYFVTMQTTGGLYWTWEE